MPKAVEKKSKTQIQKAATSKKKGAAKKWTKGKVKDKVDHACFLEPVTHDKMINSIPKIGRYIGVSTIIEKYKVYGSVARMMLRKCVENGSLQVIDKHGRQSIYAPTVQIVEKAPDAKDAGKKGKKGK